MNEYINRLIKCGISEESAKKMCKDFEKKYGLSTKKLDDYIVYLERKKLCG